MYTAESARLQKGGEVLANTTAPPGETQLRQAEGDKWEKEKEKDAMPSSRSGRAGEVTRN